MRDVGFVPSYRQLILYRFLGFQVFIIINSSTVRNQKQMKIISLNYFTGQIKKVIYVFHSKGNSFDMMIFITIIQPKIHKADGVSRCKYVFIIFILICFHFKTDLKVDIILRSSSTFSFRSSRTFFLNIFLEAAARSLKNIEIQLGAATKSSV